MTADLTLFLPDEAATTRLGAFLAGFLAAGDCLLLAGPIGAGKSHLARALIQTRLGRAEEVPSPSFTLVQSYRLPGGGQAHLFDLYRLAGAADLRELGWEDAVADIVIVEWPERLGALVPPGALDVTLRIVGDDARDATLTGWEGRL